MKGQRRSRNRLVGEGTLKATRAGKHALCF